MNMAHRNRWFTVLKNGDFPIFHGYVSHNQRVYRIKLEIRVVVVLRRYDRSIDSGVNRGPCVPYFFVGKLLL